MVRGLSRREERMAELLIRAGMNKNVARAVVYLSKVKEAVSREIEIGANLRQPEVSLAMKELRERGWVKMRELKRKGKGRPLKCYKLTVDLRDIAKGLIEKKREELKKLEEKLKELEKAIGIE